MAASTLAEPGAASAEAAAPPVGEASRTSAWREIIGGPWVRPIVAIVGSTLLAIGGLLPVWGTRLIAPQYPKGLELWFFGDRVEGPVREVNGLNHYIGMQEIDLSAVPEMELWPLAVVGPALLLLLGLFLRGWLGRIALIGLWLVPIVILADIQRWLIAFGTDLDPRAALRLEGFTPLVVGLTQVWNFSVVTYPGAALILMWVVALLATLARFAKEPEPRVRLGASVISIVIALVGAGILLLPEPADAASPGDADVPAATAPAAATLDLQRLVDEAEPGATIVVPAGSYRVHLVIDKPLTLLADGDVHLDGSGLGSVVTISADDVTVRGFSVGNTGGQVEVGSAIKIVEADGAVIEGNRLSRFFHGIAGVGATNVHVVDNVIAGSGLDGAEAVSHLSSGAAAGDTPVILGTDPRAIAPEASGNGPEGQGDGVYLWNTRAATITGNDVSGVRDGVYLSFVEDALIDGNAVDSSRYAVHSMFGGPVTVFGNSSRGNLAGLVFMYTEGVLAGRNLIEDQRSAGTGVGVLLKDVEDVRIAENVIARNRVGIKAEGTHRQAGKEAVVLRNRFDSNDTAVSLYPSADLGFGANTFSGNLTDVHADDRGVARRNDWTYQGTGNHWSAYAGYDLDADGVGDVPHAASGSLQLILSDVPALQIYRGSPALRALDSAQELWEADRAQVMEDRAPRTDDFAPTAHDLGAGDTRAAALAADAAGWYAAGTVLLLLVVVGASLGRLRRREARR